MYPYLILGVSAGSDPIKNKASCFQFIDNLQIKCVWQNGNQLAKSLCPKNINCLLTAV
jgi:hypothetical protein